MKKQCKKCGNELKGKQTAYCSRKCMRRFLKLQWQKRNRILINAGKARLRKNIKIEVIFDRKVTWHIKDLARKKLKYALKTGKLKKKSCKKCGSKLSEGHHPDYSKPLSVVWLCRKHHREVHNVLEV